MYNYKQKLNSKKINVKKISALEFKNLVKSSREGFEGIDENQAVRPYFDYDYYYKTEEERLKAFPLDLERVITELKTVYDLDKGKPIIFTSNGIDTDKKEAEDSRENNLLNEKSKARPNKRNIFRLEKQIAYYKNSINVIISGCGYFKSNNDILKPKHGTYDKNVYKSNQLIRAPFASKEGQNRFKNLYLMDRGIDYNIDTFHETDYEYEDLLITNIKGEVEYKLKKEKKSKTKKERDPVEIDINIDSDDSDQESDQESDDDMEPIEKQHRFNTIEHFDSLLNCLKVERIDNMADWLLLMRICKNIIKGFNVDDFNKSKSIIHKFMKKTPEKYKFDEVENIITKPDDIENENPASWGSLVKMAIEDNKKKYEKLLKRAGKIKKSDIFNIDRLRALRLQPRRYYWSDYNKFNNTKHKDPTEILKYLIDSSFRIMNNGKPYFMTMNKTFKEFTKHGDIVFNYSYQTMIQNPFLSLKKCCIFKLNGDEYDLYDFSITFFQKFHFSNVQMLPFPGSIDPFKTVNNENERILNNFDGFRMEKYTATKPGTYEKMLYHIKYIVCGDDAELFDYVIGWIASILQKPAIKHETCLLLQGEEGCGKNRFVDIFKRVLGENLTFDTHNIEDIVGNFNAQLSGKILVVGDELIAFAGYKKSDFIKGMLTSPNISITKKGVDTISESSFQRYIFTTNNEETLKISNNDRRICLIPVVNTKRGDYDYFNALTGEMADLDNIKALYDYLSKYDISNFDFRRAPMTQLKQDTINNQMDDIYNWFIEFIDTLTIKADQKEISILATEAYDSFKLYTNKFFRRKDVNNKMMNLLKCNYVKKNNGRCFVFNIKATNTLFKDLYKNNIDIITVSSPALSNFRPDYTKENNNEIDITDSDDDEEYIKSSSKIYKIKGKPTREDNIKYNL